MRVFFAVEIPDEIKTKFAEAESKLKEAKFECQYTSNENLHITILFLGETEEIEIKILIDILESKIKKGKFKVSMDKLGMFKNGKTPKIIFLDIQEGAEELKGINNTVSNYAKHIIYRNKLENNFKPHMTIGRIGTIEWKEIPILERIVKEYELNCGFEVEEIGVFESVLSNSGPVYKKIGTIKL